MREYFNAESDRMDVNRHIDKMKDAPIDFQNTYREILKAGAWRELQGMIIQENIKDIPSLNDLIDIRIHHMLSD